MKFYAGIGSRQTPPAFLNVMSDMAKSLAGQGYTLRSGAADGADTAFEIGARAVQGAPAPAIYVPWLGFNRDCPQRTGLPNSECDPRKMSPQAVVIARRNHPEWNRLSQSARWMHTRNVAQVLGEDCQTPSDFILCWTPGGKGKGGTGQAIRVAHEAGIPVYDMGALAMPYIRKTLLEKFGVTV